MDRRFPATTLCARVILVCFVTALALGCRSKPDAMEQELVVKEPPNRTPAAPREGLVLEAWATKNTVRINLTNYKEFPIVAGPKCFAIIPKGAREVVPFRMDSDRALLPVKQINKGESIQGFIKFGKLDDLVGLNLVFKDVEEKAEPARCVIQPEAKPEAKQPGG